jgi:ribosomal protein S18 acetylase RimI-like enzyme
LSRASTRWAIPLGMSSSPADDAVTLRPTRDDEADRTFLYALFVSTKAAEAAAMPIDAAGKDLLLAMQYRSMTATYRRDYPTARWEVVELAGEPVGLLITHVGDRGVTYVNIALLPQAQRRGLATRVMSRALEEPRRLGLPARVNVLAQNAASLRLWERIGFARVAQTPPFVELEWRP